MFRFASEYASVKFRSLSGYRLASLQPAVAAARRDGTALLQKWPPVKIPDEECRSRSEESGNYSDTSLDSGCHTGASSPQQTPIKEASFPNCRDGNCHVDLSTIDGGGTSDKQPTVRTGREGLDGDSTSRAPPAAPSKSTSDGIPLPTSITASQDDDEEEVAKEEACEDTDGNREGIVEETDDVSDGIPQTPDGRGSPVSILDGASFPRSLTAPQDVEEQEASREAKDVEIPDDYGSHDTTPSPTGIGGEQTAHQLLNTLDMTPNELSVEMLMVPPSEKTAAVSQLLTGNIQRAICQENAKENDRDTQLNEQNLATVQHLSDETQNPASPGSLKRNIPADRTTKPIKLTPCQPGSPNPLPRIDKGDLNPVMSRKGHSYSTVKLGKGDFGEVVLMQSRLDGTLMAVKRLTKVRDQRRADEAFDRETRAMSAVSSSPAFPKFLGTVDRYSFAMEFIGNPTKRTSWSAYQMFRKRCHHMKSLDWLKVSIDVTKGLMDMHEAGWTHNDLHSDNVMVCRDSENQSAAWEGKIIDLGFASRIDNPPPPEHLTAKQKQKCFKDCAQLAPEIIEGTSCYNVQSDVYSLGQLFRDIAAESRQLSCLKALGKRCTNTAVHMRPDLDEVLAELTLMHYERLNKPRKQGGLATLLRSLKNRFRA